MTFTASVHERFRSMPSGFSTYWPGFAVTAAVAVAAQFLSDHYGAPAMLMALLLGIAFHFLSEEGRCVAGIDFCAKKVLRIGVALLGMRISVDLLIGLGAGTILLLVSAIAAVLPKNEFSERNLIFTVLSVTVLSTLAMIAYPIIAQTMGLDARATGIFFGGTIHDVAQVVGAGFSVSPEAGETATLVKLIRVTMLAPVVLTFSLALRKVPQPEGETGKRPPLLPGFVVAFLIFAALNSFGFVPEMVAKAGMETSRWALLAGIVAVGMRTSLRRVLDVGGDAVALIVAETIFIALFILVGIHYLGHA